MQAPFRYASRPVLAILLLLLCIARTQADEWPVPRGQSHEPAPYVYDAGVWKQVPRAFLEDAPACVLYNGTTYLVERDGTIETITHEIARLNGRKGIDKLGEYHNIAYAPAYQKLTLNVARVLKHNGQVVEIEPKHVQLRDQSTDYQVYDPDKQLVISFPNLEVGDVYEVKWTVRGRNPEHFGHFFARYPFGDDRYPVVRDDLRVRLPKDRTFKFAMTNGKLEPRVQEDKNDRLYLWQAHHVPALPLDDNLPSKEELRTQLACSTFASWEEVGKWKEKLRADCWKCTPTIRKIVDDVTRGLQTPEEKARALAYWVRRRIRYVSVGPIRHDFTPHPPELVLENLFGDCKDQAQLLALLLREAGLLVYLVTLGALDDGQVMPEVPSPWGTHAIVLVQINGKDHWIDTTATQAPWDFLPRDDRNRVTYVTDDKGGIRLMRTPAFTPADNRIEQTTQVVIGTDGTSHCRRTMSFHGSAAVSQRDAWTEVPPGERRRLISGELQDAYSQSRLRSLNVDESTLRQLDQPVRATVEFDIRNHFAGESEREGNLADNKLWGRLLAFNLDPDREPALELGNPFKLSHHYQVQLPAAYRYDGTSRAHAVNSKWGTFEVTVMPDSGDAHKLDVYFHTRIDRTRVDHADFAAYQRFHDEVAKHWRAWLTLKATDSLDDAPLLEKLLASDKCDDFSATTLARLYALNGKMDDARRVLQKALAAHPDSAALWEMTVKAAASVQEEETAYREMVRRFPKESKYAVALGATLVKRGNHAGARAVLEPLARKGSETVRGAAHLQLARNALGENKPAVALEQLEAAGRADAESTSTVTALLLKGQVYERLKQVPQAESSYRHALKLDGDGTEVLAALIRLELSAGKRDDALYYLRRYSVAVGDDAQGLTRAADFYRQLQRNEDAQELAARAQKLRESERAHADP
jgi:transglutaminase-like putative cysteine protease/tetratricopeptide (TPR) repeat protein